MTTSVRNNVLLYRLSLSVWTARKLDKSESAKVTQAANAKDGTARVHKDLLPDCPELEAIRKWSTQLRTFVYLATLPWDDAGWRAGNVAKHMDFMSDVGDRIREGDALVDQFIAVYQQAIAQAQFELADMFNAADYDTAEQVRRKFSFSIDVMPITNTDDFRVVEGLSQGEADRLVASAQAGVEERVKAAMEDANQRLYDVVAKMASTLSAFGAGEIKKFNDTLVSNISDLVQVMPALNLTNDPKLAELATKAKELALYSAVDLRKDPAVREAAMTEARALAELMQPTTIPVSYEQAVGRIDRPAAKPAAAALYADMLAGD